MTQEQYLFYLIAVSSDNSSRTKVGKLLGRAGDLIWSNFDTKYNGHKVISNKCKICKVAVSARAKRMKSHVMTCSCRTCLSYIPL